MTEVGNVYGQSLYELAKDEGLSREIGEQLTVLQKSFGEEPDFVRLLSNPSLSKPERAFFELTITCRALFLIFKDSGEVDAGTADVLVDGEFRFTADPHVNNWLHCNAVLVFQEKETAAHTVRIQMSGENLDKKFTILGFGYVE